MPKVRELIINAVLAERERCARIADDEPDIAAKIRSARPPQVKVIRPETAAKHPERVDSETIIAGASYAGLG